MKALLTFTLLVFSVSAQDFYVATKVTNLTVINTVGLPLGTNFTKQWFRVVPNTNATAFALEIAAKEKAAWTNRLTKAQYSAIITNLVQEKNLLTNGWTTNSFKQ